MVTEQESIASDPFENAFGAPDTGNDGGEGGSQPRDEQGRFAAQQERDEAAADDNSGDGQPASTDDGEGGRVPAWRLRELREERDRERQEREAERRQWEAERRELEQLRQMRDANQQQPEDIPDVLIDPEGYAAYVGGQATSIAEAVRREMVKTRVDSTFEDAKDQNPERFNKAYEAILEAKRMGDPIVDRITNAPNPGRALMRWYGQQEAIRETGGDLTAYEQKVREKAMKDPEFRKQILADIEAEARGGGNSMVVNGSNAPTLPSLNRMTGGRRDDGGGGDVFQQAFGGPQRR